MLNSSEPRSDFTSHLPLSLTSYLSSAFTSQKGKDVALGGTRTPNSGCRAQNTNQLHHGSFSLGKT